MADLKQLPAGVLPNGRFTRVVHRYSELAKGAYASDDENLAVRTGMRAEQLLHVDFSESSGAFPRPAFYLAVDERLECLVVCILSRQAPTLSPAVLTGVARHSRHEVNA